MKNLTWYEHLAAGWPLAIGVAVGGAIGGACGGLAYAVSAQIFNSELPNVTKHLLSLSIGLGAGLLYIFAVMILALVFPQFFGG